MLLCVKNSTTMQVGTLILPEILKTQSPPQGKILCTFGSRTFVPIRWMCKKQTSVSHSSTESEVMSLDAGLRMEGIPALDLWDLVIEVLQFLPVHGNLLRDKEQRKHTNT